MAVPALRHPRRRRRSPRPVADVAALDGNRDWRATASRRTRWPGAIALISRGTCTFEDKLNNAQAAGAVGRAGLQQRGRRADHDGGQLGDASGRDDVDGGRAGAPAAACTRRRLARSPCSSRSVRSTSDPAHCRAFRRRGRISISSVKPDMVAVGGNLYTAAQKLDSDGVMYDPSGYTDRGRHQFFVAAGGGGGGAGEERRGRV